MEYIGYKIGVMKGDKFDYLIAQMNTEPCTPHSNQGSQFRVLLGRWLILSTHIRIGDP